MNTVLLVTHPGIGSALRTAALATLKTLHCKVIAVDCPQDVDTDQIAENTLKKLPTEGNLIIFSDIYGATPHNLAASISKQTTLTSKLISGVNLPILLRTLNYINEPLDDVCKKAVEGGKASIAFGEDS